VVKALGSREARELERLGASRSVQTVFARPFTGAFRLGKFPGGWWALRAVATPHAAGKSLGNLGQSKRVLTPITPEGWEIAAIATVIGENTVKLLETFL
jgi:hypothetical protein